MDSFSSASVPRFWSSTWAQLELSSRACAAHQGVTSPSQILALGCALDLKAAAGPKALQVGPSEPAELGCKASLLPSG